MKRFLILVLVALMLTGCAFSGNRMNDPVTFYYLRIASDDATYDAYYADGIIGSEEREASGYRGNLRNLLTFYFRGPLDPNLTSPFPTGCRILDVSQKSSRLIIQLNPILAEKTEVEITAACACLAMTCMELTDVDTVQIEAKNAEDKVLFSRTITGENLFLNDEYTQITETTQ